MRKILTFAFLLSVMFTAASCGEDDPYNGSIAPSGNTTSHAEAVPGRVAIAYCTYYGKLVPDGNVVTNVNYGFAELYVKDGRYKGFKLQGDEERFKQVLRVKEKNPNVKISLSFSHTVSNSDNAQGGGFSVMSSTEEGRKAFAKDCLAFVRKWNIDGIDIDWEFPGLSWSGHACDPAHDVENYTLLMKQLRETLGNDILLTYAGYVMDVKGEEGDRRYIDIKAVDPYVDFVNVMTYDIASGKEGQHQSAWDRPTYYYDIKRTIQSYLDAGVAPGKIVLGIPFYARHAWDNSDGYKGCVDYKDFPTEYPASKGFKTDNWDDKGGDVPYITKDGRMWAGYDNPRSIGIKAERVIKMGMKGLMYWDYDADDAQGTLRNAVWESIMKKDN